MWTHCIQGLPRTLIVVVAIDSELPRAHHKRHPHEIRGDDDTQHEREIIESTLSQSPGRRSGPKGAAVRLGLSPSTLDARIKKLNWFKLPIDAKRIHNILGFPQFHELPTALLFSLPILFNYFTMALRLHFLKVRPLTRCLSGRRGRMACKVERIVERGHLALFHISGYLQEMHVHLIEEMMAKETDPVAFDLAEVTLVGSEAVKFLATCDAKGIEIRNCPAFIREWMSKA